MAEAEISFDSLKTSGVSEFALQMLKSTPLFQTARSPAGLVLPGIWYLGPPSGFPDADVEHFLSALWPHAVAHFGTHAKAQVKKGEKICFFLSLSLTHLFLSNRVRLSKLLVQGLHNQLNRPRSAPLQLFLLHNLLLLQLQLVLLVWCRLLLLLCLQQRTPRRA